MKKTNTTSAIVILCWLLFGPAFAQNPGFNLREVACGLNHPWEVTWGPDNHLWVTEARSYQVTRINPVTGVQQVLADLSDMRDFPVTQDPWPQGGLMGLALHPQLLSGQPYVYLAYVHHFDSCAAGNGGCFFKTKVVRYTYNPASFTLSNEEVLVDTVPGSSDHNGGRLAIGTLGGGTYLFYTVGDMGAGHLGNGDRQHNGQNTNFYEGKILRFNLAPDADGGAFDRWIPNTNPFNTFTRQSAVYTYGHRNPQGLVFNNGILYEAEHGPYSDDEVNIISAGKNYGFPLVMGFADGNYDGSAAGAGSGVPVIPSEVAEANALGAAYMEPIGSYFPVDKATVSTIYTNDENDTPPFDNYYLSWPTIAPSGIDYYGSNAIPGWNNSLLVTALKLGRVYRLQLAPDGLSITGDTIPVFASVDRFRDIAISPDGAKIYVATDSVGQIRGNMPGEALFPTHKGCILEYASTTTSVGEATDAAAFTLFPNPADRRLNLDLSRLPAGRIRLAVYNRLGALILEQDLDNQYGAPASLDVSAWPEGQYVLSVQTDGQAPAMRKVTVLRK
jgi:PQQ-dependent dehydrogenase (s-GDH family)